MEKKTLYLICNAHLDPVWLWNMEEGISAALSTTTPQSLQIKPSCLLCGRPLCMYFLLLCSVMYSDWPWLCF